MRITNPMVVRNYTNNLHKNRAMLEHFSNQIVTGRRFNKMSEDTAAGVRAMQVRRNLSRIDAHIDNAKAAQSQLGAAETTLLQISELTHSISEKHISGMSDDKTTERGIIATELEKLRDQLMSLANSQFAGRYMFGGTNTVTPPFETDDLGNIFYNGTDIRTLDKSHPLIKDAAHLDIGLGLTFNNAGDPQLVDPNSAFKHTLVGAEFLGLGSENIYLVLTEMIDSLRAEVFDHEAAGNILNRFRESAANVNIQITKLGADSQYLEFSIDRLETEAINLKTRQTDLEAAAPEEAIMNMKIQEFIYNAALQMGQRLLQPTLFSFIN